MTERAAPIRPISAAARSPVILPAMQELASVERGGVQLETELTYDGLTHVPVRVTKRDGRYKVTDDGGAVSAAGLAGRRVAYPEHIAFGEYSVNVTRQGIVWLPAVSPSDAWLATACDLVARGSVALYERLLELDEPSRPRSDRLRLPTQAS